MSASIKTVGNWSNQMEIPLHNALAATIELSGRSGRSAVERAMVMMAQSARKVTKQAKKNRKKGRDKRGEYYFADKKAKYNIYKWWWDTDSSTRGILMRNQLIRNTLKSYPTFEQAQPTPSRGLAKRSWFWGLAGLSRSTQKSKSIPGVASLREIHEKMKQGLALTNRLNYIFKAAPTNVEQIAAKAATNRIMNQAAKKMERQYGVIVPRLAASRRKKRLKSLNKAFKEARAA